MPRVTCVLTETDPADMKAMKKWLMALFLTVADQLLNNRLYRQNIPNNPNIHGIHSTTRLPYDYPVIKTKMREHRTLQPLHPLKNNFLSRLLCPDRVEHVAKGGNLHAIQPLYTDSKVWRMMARIWWRHKACQGYWSQMIDTECVKGLAVRVIINTMDKFCGYTDTIWNFTVHTDLQRI